MARRFKLPGLDGIRDLPDSIRRRRGDDADAKAEDAPPPTGAPADPGKPPPPSGPPAATAPPPPAPAGSPAETAPGAPQPPAASDAQPTRPLPPVAPGTGVTGTGGAAPPTGDPAPLPPPPGPAPEPREPGSGRGSRARGPLLIGLGVLAAAGAGLGAGYLLFDEDAPPAPPPVAPTVVVEEGDEPTTEALGFPGFATLNTTRVGGADAVAVAAGTALAAYPSEGEVGRPRLVTVVPADSWQAGIAAASLTTSQIGGPMLLSTTDEVPTLTQQAIAALRPTGVKRADGTQLVTVGGAKAPGNLESTRLDGETPAALADRIDRERAKLSGVKDPDNIIVVTSSSERADFAMPAAAWAARSGDPIVFADGSDVPEETLAVLERHPDASVYVLGPDSVISAKAIKKLEGAGVDKDPDGNADAGATASSRKVVRIDGPDPVENSIEFARFSDGTFGWNINDPGHGFVIASNARPADAGAAAPLSAAGKPGPLLLTDDPDTVPKPLAGFLLDTKPGYVDDPTRAIYNHVWIIGDSATISIPFQAEVDRITELSKVRSSTGEPELGPTPGTPEPERGGGG